mgnify:FL=1
MKLRIKKNPLARVAFRIFVLCLCLLASTAHATAQEVVYELVTNASQLVAGEKYIIATADGKYAMGKQKVDNKNRDAVSIDNKKAGNYIIGIAIASEQEQEDKVYEFTLGGKVGGWTFYDGTYPGYLYASGKNKAFGNVKNNQNYLETKMLLDKKSKASINIESGEVCVKFAHQEKDIVNILRYNSNSNLFSCYVSGQKPISLYRKVKHIAQLSVSKYGYTTYTSQENSYSMPEGCQGFVVTKENEGIKLTEKYKPGDAVPAKTPLLIKAEPGTYPIYQTVRKAVASAEGENLLRGDFDADGKITYGLGNAKNYYYYKLTTQNKANFGFYFGTKDGGPFKMSNTSRAYLVLPREQSSSVKSLVLDDAILETAVSLPTESKPTDGHTYDLSGRLCQGKLVPGIYIQNGRKIVVR